MIKTETVTINETEFKRTFSDEGYCIKKVGTNEVYSEAVDLPDSTFTYEETDEKLLEESKEEPQEEQYNYPIK